MNKIIILGHENPDVDSIVSGYLLEKIMLNMGYDVKYIIPDKEISNSERRKLSTFPDIKLNSEYISKVDKYFLDHFLPQFVFFSYPCRPENTETTNYVVPYWQQS